MPVELPLAARVPITGGYCWSFYFKVLGVLFLGEVSPGFLPSKQACWMHKFRHLGVGQQYPGDYLPDVGRTAGEWAGRKNSQGVREQERRDTLAAPPVQTEQASQAGGEEKPSETGRK
jgi:hypothetical protein